MGFIGIGPDPQIRCNAGDCGLHLPRFTAVSVFLVASIPGHCCLGSLDFVLRRPAGRLARQAVRVGEREIAGGLNS